MSSFYAGFGSRKIEFIGNSITCGYGNEGTNKFQGFEYETENHYYSYAAITARNLKAQHWVVARSGIGAYRNYNGPKTGNPESNMERIAVLTIHSKDYAIFNDKFNQRRYYIQKRFKEICKPKAKVQI